MDIGIFRPINKVLIDRKSDLNKAIDNGVIKKSVSQLADSKAILPVLLLEGTVILGRCSQAKKRDELEFKERFREELLTSATWLFGVDAFNKSFDYALKKILKLDTSADIFKDDVLKRFTKGRSEAFKNTLIGAKFTKVAISTAATIYIIGSLIPKLNQSLTQKDIAKAKAKLAQSNAGKTMNLPANSLINGLPNNHLNQKLANFGTPTFRNNNTKPATLISNQPQKTPVSFKGNFLNLVNTVGFNMESNPWFKLWTGDAGVSGGRAIHARNKDERTEILFRDVGSIFFYMFSTSMTINALSKMFDPRLGIYSEINPSLVTHLNESILQHSKIMDKAKSEKGINYTEFEHALSGRTIRAQNESLLGGTIEPAVKNEINEAIALRQQLKAQSNLSDEIRVIANKLQEKGQSTEEGLCKQASALADELFKNSRLGIVDERVNNVEQLITHLKSKFSDVMDTKIIQDITDAAKTATVKLSDAEHNAALKGGLINNPEFMGEACKIAFGPTWSDKVINFIDPKRHIEASDIEAVSEHIDKYTEKLLAHVKKEIGDKTIDDIKLSEIITGFKNKTALTKIAYSACGFAVSALFLSTLIPKWQQMITKMRTGSDKFPGTKDMQA
ncbi:MAG: hypothetical protein WCK67_03395 [bacterium]